MFEFQPFDKIARLKREVVITEKIDGTNAQIAIFPLETPDQYFAVEGDPYCLHVSSGPEAGDSPLAIYAGSRKRWIAPEGDIYELETMRPKKGTDNFAFAQFVRDNADELLTLGPGRHYGEWYGAGIQRGYGLTEKRFALFNAGRWGDHNLPPSCCEVVPVIPGFQDPEEAMVYLAMNGSLAVPGYDKPEGIVVYHTASRTLYKQTFEQDEGKWNT